MSIKERLKALMFTSDKEPESLCKRCLEKYWKHEQVEHFTCYFMIQNSGSLDVKAPTKRKDRETKK